MKNREEGGVKRAKRREAESETESEADKREGRPYRLNRDFGILGPFRERHFLEELDKQPPY